MRRDTVLLISSALMLILSFAPFNLFVLAWVGLVPLFFAMDGKGPRGAFITGFVWGLIFSLGTIYWVVNSMYYYGGVPVYIGCAVLLLLAAYMALYYAFFGLGFSVTAGLGHVTRILFTASSWVALEYLRGHLFSGFPWDLLGYSQATFLHVIQVADISGVWGVSFILVLFNAMLYMVLKSGMFIRDRPLISAVTLSVGATLAVLVYGIYRTERVDFSVSEWKGIRAGVVQGSIEQSRKWDPGYKLETVEIYRGLTKDLTGEGVDLVVWPETAMPFFLQSDAIFAPLVYDVPREIGSYLLAGSPAYARKDGRVEYYNSAFLLSPEGEVLNRYDKVHLVPFGEYVPLKKVLFFIDKLTEGIGDFTPGSELKPLKLTDRRSIGVLICFESIFPELARGLTKRGAGLMAVITNDAWFGKTAAPYQHFDMAVFRAVENRIFVLRAANTGISGVIDPVGRTVAKKGLFERGAIIGEVAYKGGLYTVYTRYGDYFPLLSSAFSLLSLTYVFTGLRRSM